MDHTLSPTPTPGLTIDWLHDHQIVVYRLQTMSAKLLQHWTETAINLIQQWPEGKPYLALHDLSGKGVSLAYAVQVQYDLLNLGISPQGRQRIEPWLDLHPAFTGQVALVFSSSFSGNVGQVFATLKKTYHPGLQFKSYFDEDSAVEWLVERVRK